MRKITRHANGGIFENEYKIRNPINPIFVGCLYFIWDVLAEERGRNLDPCQIDNFVSSLSPPLPARISPD